MQPKAKAITDETYNDVRYRVLDGTYYHRETTDELIRIFHKLWKSKVGFRVHFGDSVTGRDWLEENDVYGVLSRSQGPVKAPLLIVPGEAGGPALSTQSVVRIRRGGKDIYRHPKYNIPAASLQLATDKRATDNGYRFVVRAGRVEQANFKTLPEALGYILALGFEDWDEMQNL